MKQIILSRRFGVALFLAVGCVPGWGAAKVDFASDIKGILESACLVCHQAKKSEGKLRMETRELAIKGGQNGPSLVPGNPEQSPLYISTIMPPDHDDVMPPDPPLLSQRQTDLLRQWILEGAVWPASIVLRPVRRILFAQDIQPILEAFCLSCHLGEEAKGHLRLDTQEKAFQGGENGVAIVPGRPEESPLYTMTVLPADHDDLMPPIDKGGPLAKGQTDLMKAWIQQGADWPPGVMLQASLQAPGQASKAPVNSANEPVVVETIHKEIVETLGQMTPETMQPYTNTIPGTQAQYIMLPIPGGEFNMGSPESEADRNADEGPVHRVKVDPFWMGQCEVTWEQFEPFMYPAHQAATADAGAPPTGPADEVARPSAPYVDLSFGMGKDGYPAISMTQHAANKYCEWLSALTGHFYRLPTEAEWEYACRAGTTTAYSFGDDPAQLDDYAWYADNSNWKYQKVGTKKPNPWGLFDMHGNVTEWCLDQYAADYYQQFGSTVADNPWNKATAPYPHVVRGGSWDDDPDQLRSAVRRASDPVWKMQDPQLPKSVWYHTDAQFLGFRIVRPLKVPPPDKLFQYWNSGVEKE